MKTTIIYSGGLDSTVLLYHLLNQGHQVQALTVAYGQRHFVEMKHAAKICRNLCVEWRLADLRPIQGLIGTSSQTNTAIPVPHGHYAEESMKATVVPNRNMIMLAVAGGWAIATKCDFIAYGAHAGDHAIYPDCRDEFVNPLEQALLNADWHKVQILRPFIGKTKANIVEIGAALGVPFEDTWSCYEGEGKEHCGKCGTCVERREAFQIAEVADPTTYKA